MAFSKWSQKNNFFFSNSFFLNFEISGDMGKKDFFLFDRKKNVFFCENNMYLRINEQKATFSKWSQRAVVFSKYWYFRTYGQKLFGSQTNVLCWRYEQKTTFSKRSQRNFNRNVDVFVHMYCIERSKKN